MGRARVGVTLVLATFACQIPTSAVSLGNDAPESAADHLDAYLQLWDKEVSRYMASTAVGRNGRCEAFCGEKDVASQTEDHAVVTHPSQVVDALVRRDYDSPLSAVGQPLSLKDHDNRPFTYFGTFGTMATCRQPALAKTCGGCAQCRKRPLRPDGAPTNGASKKSVTACAAIGEIMKDCYVTAFTEPSVLQDLSATPLSTPGYTEGDGGPFVTVGATVQNGQSTARNPKFVFAEKAMPAHGVNDVGFVNRHILVDGLSGLYEGMSVGKDVWYPTWGYRKCAPADPEVPFKVKIECPTKQVPAHVEFLGSTSDQPRSFAGEIRIENAMYGRSVGWDPEGDGSGAGQDKRRKRGMFSRRPVATVGEPIDHGDHFNAEQEPALMFGLSNYSCKGHIGASTAAASDAPLLESWRMQGLLENSTSCSMPAFVQYAQAICEGAETSCELDIGTLQQQEGDPCPDQSKYAEVHYWCMYEEAVDELFAAAASANNVFPGEAEGATDMVQHLSERRPRAGQDQAMCDIALAADMCNKFSSTGDSACMWCPIFRQSPVDLLGTNPGSLSVQQTQVLVDDDGRPVDASDPLEPVAKQARSTHLVPLSMVQARAAASVAAGTKAMPGLDIILSTSLLGFLIFLYLFEMYVQSIRAQPLAWTMPEEHHITREQFYAMFISNDMKPADDLPSIDGQKLAYVADMDLLKAKSLVERVSGGEKRVHLPELFEFMDDEGRGIVDAERVGQVLYSNFPQGLQKEHSEWFCKKAAGKFIEDVEGLPDHVRFAAQAGKLEYTKRGYQRIAPQWNPYPQSPYFKAYVPRSDFERTGTPSYRYDGVLRAIREELRR